MEDFCNYYAENNVTIISTNNSLSKFKFKAKVKCNFCKTVWNTNYRNYKRNTHACRQCFLAAKRIHFLNENSFLNEDDVSFYILGIWYSDGNVFNRGKNSKLCGFTSKDKGWITAIRDLISPGRKIQNVSGRSCYQLQINSANFYNWLVKWGCVEKKSLIIQFPKNIPKKYLPDFIRGLIDGDGCICLYNRNHENSVTKKIETYICSASENFIVDLKLCLESLGFNIYFSVKTKKKGIKVFGKILKKESKSYRAIANGLDAIKLLEWAYYSEHKISLKRKLKTFKKAKKIIK